MWSSFSLFWQSSAPAISFVLEVSREHKAPIYSAWQTLAVQPRGPSTSYLRTTSRDLPRSLVHEADSRFGWHLSKPENHSRGWDAWASLIPWILACKASPERENQGWVDPWAKWLPVGRQSGNCSEAMGGLGHRLTTSLRDLWRVGTCLLCPTRLPGLQEGLWRIKDPWNGVTS